MHWFETKTRERNRATVMSNITSAAKNGINATSVTDGFSIAPEFALTDDKDGCKLWEIPKDCNVYLPFLRQVNHCSVVALSFFCVLFNLIVIVVLRRMARETTTTTTTPTSRKTKNLGQCHLLSLAVSDVFVGVANIIGYIIRKNCGTDNNLSPNCVRQYGEYLGSLLFFLILNRLLTVYVCFQR